MDEPGGIAPVATTSSDRALLVAQCAYEYRRCVGLPAATPVSARIHPALLDDVDLVVLQRAFGVTLVGDPLVPFHQVAVGVTQ